MASDLGKFRMKVTDIIKDKFKDIGYKVKMKLLKASDFGVPQNRERVIFIGVRNDIAKEITYPEKTHNADGSDGKKKHQTVKEAIDDLKESPENKETHHIYTNHSEAFTQKIKNTKVGESVNKKYTEAFFRCSPDKPSNTVKENHGGVFVHYEKDRVMTPRELARLQSFPDDYMFKGTKSSVLVQLGNAVPCGLSRAIAKEIKKIFI
jgi:DNA (cytosine-5)-methyltransferase 1